jgi:protein required for attachment to host cells
MKPKTTWLVLADGQRARAYRYLGEDHMPEPEADFEFDHKGVPSREMTTDGPGRMQASGGNGGSAFSPRNDPHEQAEERFLDHVAAKLAEAVDAGRCDAIILSAPPTALGHLRQKLSPATQKLMMAEINKDFTKTAVRDLGKLVAHHMATHHIAA